MTSEDASKKAAGEAAAALVEPGMTVGLGTGSTAAHFIRALGGRVAAGLDLRGVATSRASAALAEAAGIELIDPDETTAIELAVDGADEIAPGLALTKGGGGALLREKIVAAAARRFVVIADASKRVAELGAFPTPIEIAPFAYGMTVRRLKEALAELGYAGARLALRAGAGGAPFVTDGGGLIVDCALGRIADPAAVDRAARALPGVFETGLFVGLAHEAIIAGPRGIERVTS